MGLPAPEWMCRHKSVPLLIHLRLLLACRLWDTNQLCGVGVHRIKTSRGNVGAETWNFKCHLRRRSGRGALSWMTLTRKWIRRLPPLMPSWDCGWNDGEMIERGKFLCICLVGPLPAVRPAVRKIRKKLSSSTINEMSQLGWGSGRLVSVFATRAGRGKVHLSRWTDLRDRISKGEFKPKTVAPFLRVWRWPW